MTITKARQAEIDAARDEAREVLREIFPLNSTVTMMVTHVSSNGMSRHIVVLSATPKGNIRNVSRLVARATGQRLNRDGDALLVGGCGMSMTFATAYSLGSALYGDTHVCTGDRECRSNDHTNGAPYIAGGVHNDGGYSLRDSVI